LRDQRFNPGLGLIEFFGKPFDFVGFGRDILAQLIVFRPQSMKQRDKMIESVFEALKVLFHALKFIEKTLLRQWLRWFFESFLKFVKICHLWPMRTLPLRAKDSIL